MASLTTTSVRALGATEVPDRPERVVSVSSTEQDLLPLGVVPIAATQWYVEEPNAVWSWATEQLGAAEVEVLVVADGINFERIIELEPDLFIGTKRRSHR